MFRTILPGQISTGVKNQHDKIMRQWRAYRTDESGSLLVLGLFCFVMMLLLSGFALDAMRAELLRGSTASDRVLPHVRACLP